MSFVCYIQREWYTNLIESSDEAFVWSSGKPCIKLDGTMAFIEL